MRIGRGLLGWSGHAVAGTDNRRGSDETAGANQRANFFSRDYGSRGLQRDGGVQTTGAVESDKQDGQLHSKTRCTELPPARQDQAT